MGSSDPLTSPTNVSTRCLSKESPQDDRRLQSPCNKEVGPKVCELKMWTPSRYSKATHLDAHQFHRGSLVDSDAVPHNSERAIAHDTAAGNDLERGNMKIQVSWECGHSAVGISVQIVIAPVPDLAPLDPPHRSQLLYPGWCMSQAPGETIERKASKT